ncbi:hypothetical protein SNEBB_009834 [Seison nebaliae]|nr:hypothetical protein SNEBB_009834 [Seison nebaliae]
MYHISTDCSVEVLPSQIPEMGETIIPTTQETTTIVSTKNYYNSSAQNKWSGNIISPGDQVTITINKNGNDQIIKLWAIYERSYVIEYIEGDLDEDLEYQICNVESVSFYFQNNKAIIKRKIERKYFLYVDDDRKIAKDNFDDYNNLNDLPNLTIMITQYGTPFTIYANINKDITLIRRSEVQIIESDSSILQNGNLKQQQNVQYIINKDKKQYTFIFNFITLTLLEVQLNCMEDSEKTKVNIQYPRTIQFRSWNNILLEDGSSSLISRDDSETDIEFLLEEDTMEEADHILIIYRPAL